jgi:hypothetical protein
VDRALAHAALPIDDVCKTVRRHDHGDIVSKSIADGQIVGDKVKQAFLQALFAYMTRGHDQTRKLNRRHRETLPRTSRFSKPRSCGLNPIESL